MSAAAPDVELIALDPPISDATMIKIWAVSWENHVSLRADIRGCAATTVAKDELVLDVPKTTLLPSLFTTSQSLHNEFRGHIADALGCNGEPGSCSIDQVQVISTETFETTKSKIILHILPKVGATDPATLNNELDAVLGDSGSALSQYMNLVENSKDKVQITHADHNCQNVDCKDHGQCYGGECFCFEGWAGMTCEERYDVNAPLTNSKGEMIDPKTGEIVTMETDQTSLIDELEPLKLEAAGEVMQMTGANEEDETEEELNNDILELAEKSQEEALDDEEGFSGIVKRHFIIVALVIAGLLICGGLLVCVASRKKGEPLLDIGASDDEPLPAVQRG